LAIELGDLEAAKDRLRALRAERERLEQEIAAAEADLDGDALRQQIEAELADLRAAFEGDPNGARGALRALLGSERLRGRGRRRPGLPGDRDGLAGRGYAPGPGRSGRLRAGRNEDGSGGGI